MRYRKLGKSGIEVSVIGMGTWAIGGDAYGKTDDKQSIEAIHAAVDGGVNLIDTAYVYGSGHSEQVVGQALKGLDRSKIVVATKCGNWRAADGSYYRDGSPAALRRGLENSLTFMGIDYIDLLQFHWPDPNTPIAESFTELNKMVQEGKVRAIGVSNFSCEQMDEAAKVCEICTLQPPYSLLDRAFEDVLQDYCIDHNMGVLSYGSIGAGVLSGKYTSRPTFPEGDTRNRFYAKFFTDEAWPKTAALVDVLREIAAARGVPTVHAAINWVLAQRGVTTALVGAKTAEQAAMNAAAGDWEMTADEVAAIEAAYAKIFA